LWELGAGRVDDGKELGAMGKAVLAGIFTLAASAALAQTAATTDPAGGGRPANLCQELLAFMQAPPPESPATAAAPAKAAEAKQAEASAAPGSNQAAAASAPASGQAVPPKSSQESSSSQQLAGQTGPAAEAPDANAKPPAKEGTAENAPQKASVSAPVPTDGEAVAKESVLSVAEAEDLAEANDIAACQSAARELRLAGVAVPPPLLALAALDLRFHPDAGPQPQAPETQKN
jgi:hypothetical protein